MKSAVRKLVRENRLSPYDLVMPIFVIDGTGIRKPLSSLPGLEAFSSDELCKEVSALHALGIQAIALFPIIASELKNETASEAYNEASFYHKAIRMLKEEIPEICIITDISLDPYSSQGHDGLVSPKGEILNDETLELLAKMAICQAQAGADMLAPSDMMDGRVAYIRSALDKADFYNVGIISYTAKYASSFYAPFRDVLSSAPVQGDKKSYQMDSANKREALWEGHLDIIEGADILLVKPGLMYLDVLAMISQNSPIPVAVYNVSGEYTMLKSLDAKTSSASNLEIWDYKSCVLEVLLSFKRAGADIIFTYHAKEVANWLHN